MEILNGGIFIPIDSLQIQCDYETGDRCGAGGFQVISATAITDSGDFDVTEYVDQGKHYYELDEVAEDLGLNGIDVEEV